MCLAVFKAQKARRELEQARLDEDFDYNTGLKRRKTEAAISHETMRLNAQFQYEQALAKQSLQEREDAHQDSRSVKRYKLKKEMVEFSMEGQHSRTMDLIAEKSHFLQSSSRLQLVTSSSQQQQEESSVVVRHSSSNQQRISSDGQDDEDSEEDLKAFFKGSSKN